MLIRLTEEHEQYVNFGCRAMSETEKEGTSIQKRLGSSGGKLKKYCDTVLGRSGLMQCMLYEVVMLFAAPVPGQFGAGLRSTLYPLLFGDIGPGVYFGTNIIFRRPKLMRVGKGSTIGNGVVLDIKMNGQSINIDRGVTIGDKTLLSCIGGAIYIGKKSRVGRHCRLGSFQGLNIGQRCKIGDRVCLVGAGHSYESLDIPIIEQPLTCRGPSCIGSGVVIGEGVTILDGVRLGNGVTVAQGSFVNRNAPDDVRLRGVPAYIY